MAKLVEPQPAWGAPPPPARARTAGRLAAAAYIAATATLSHERDAVRNTQRTSTLDFFNEIHAASSHSGAGDLPVVFDPIAAGWPPVRHPFAWLCETALHDMIHWGLRRIE
jgi:hypothetical protein